MMKYTTLVICPIVSYGTSTGFAPIHVRIKNEVARTQNEIFLIGLYLVDIECFFLKGKITMIRIDKTRAITPPNLFGIDRRMA